MARELYAGDALPDLEGLDTVYALDSSTIDLCLSVFPWAPFRSTKAAIKLHTLPDLRGSIPSFIHISDGKMHMSECSIFLSPSPARSTSWIVAIWTSTAWLGLTTPEAFL
jgi:hypothetical protein